MTILTVLIMDDAAIVRNLIGDLLRESNGVVAIVEADDALSAMNLMAEHRPQIAILDIKIPGSHGMQNGIDVLRAIKAAYPNTGTIMLTNYADAIYRAECLRAGADFFFDKSSEFGELTAAVDALCESGRN